MVIFTHDQESTPEAHWLQSPGITAMSELRIDWEAFEKLVVISAHPDDETLGASGLLQRAAAHGIDTTIIVATWGEKSHPHSPTHSPADLKRLRSRELGEALDMVCPEANVIAMGLPDGELSHHRNALEKHVVEAVGSTGTSLIVAPWRHDAHADHDAAGEAAARACRKTGSVLLEYPIWMWHWADPQSNGDSRADIPWPALRRLELETSEQMGKAAALTRHASQIEPLSPAKGDEALLSGQLLAHFRRTFETFIDVAGHFAPSGRSGENWIRKQFDSIHAGGAEPWDPSDWYEHRKRAVLLAGLDRPVFRSGVELGCSTGALLEALAPRCEQLVGVDASAEALASARRRTARLDAVDCRQGFFPEYWPAGRFDLFVLSESGYYLRTAALTELVDRVAESALPAALLVACHWRHPIEGWPLDGADVHHLLRGDDRLNLLGGYVEDDFQLDYFRVGGQP